MTECSVRAFFSVKVYSTFAENFTPELFLSLFILTPLKRGHCLGVEGDRIVSFDGILGVTGCRTLCSRGVGEVGGEESGAKVKGRCYR